MPRTITCEFYDRITADVAINSLRADQEGIRNVVFSGKSLVKHPTEYTIGSLPVDKQSIGIPSAYESVEDPRTDFVELKTQPAPAAAVKILCDDGVATDVMMKLIGLGAEKIKYKN